MLDHLDPEQPFEAGPGARQAVAERAGRIHRRRRLVRVGGGGGIAVAVVVALVLALVSTGGDDDGREVATAGLGGQPSETTTTLSPTTTVPSTTEATSPPAVTSTTSAAVGPSGGVAGGVAGGAPATATVAVGDLFVKASVDPGDVEAGELFRVRVRVRDRDGVVTSFRAQYGDGQGTGFAADLACPAPGDAGPAGASPTDQTLEYEHAYRRPGSYEIRVDVETASCSAPAERAQVAVPVEVRGERSPSNGPRAPVAGFAGPAGNAVEGFTATASGRDDDGYISVMEIDWGDGSAPEVVRFDAAECVEQDGQWPHSARSVEHDYAPGSYAYRVTVTSVGCDGRDTQDATVTGRLDVLPTGPSTTS